MVDSIKLKATKFRIGSDSELEYCPTLHRGEIIAEKWKGNRDTLRVSGLRIPGGVQMLTLELSAPKYLYGGPSLQSVGESDYQRLVSRLDSDLAGFGVEVDSGVEKDFWLSRIDYCRNLSISSDVSDVIRGCSTFTMTRRAKEVYGVETITHFNGTRSFSMYDKISELTQDKNISLELARKLQGMSHNVLRCESRLLRKRSVGGAVGTKRPSLADAWSMDMSRRILLTDFDSMRNPGKGVIVPMYHEDLERLREIMDERKRGAFMFMLTQDGAQRFMQRRGNSLEVARRFLTDAGLSRATVKRHLLILRKHMALAMSESTHNLLSEIREKLAA